MRAAEDGYIILKEILVLQPSYAGVLDERNDKLRAAADEYRILEEIVALISSYGEPFD